MLCAGVVLLAVAGCAREGGSSPGAPGGEAPRGKTFVSTAVTAGGSAKPLIDGTRVQLIFHDDGRLSASAGCNTIQGKARVDGGRLVLDEAGTTEMGCDQPRHVQDEWLATFLAAGPAITVTGDELVLEHDGTQLRLTDKAVAEPALPLAGTRWVVDTLVDGQASSTVPLGTEEAFLVFGADGTVTGFTGCNDLSGPYSVAGGKLTFGELITTKKACADDAGTLEAAVLAALRGSAPYTIEGRKLSIGGGGGAGLGLAAA